MASTDGASIASLPWVPATPLPSQRDHTVEERAAAPQIDTGHTAQETQQLLDEVSMPWSLRPMSATQRAFLLWTRSSQNTSRLLRKLLSMVRLCCQQASRCRPKQMSVYLNMNDGRISWIIYTAGSIILHEYTILWYSSRLLSRRERTLANIYGPWTWPGL